MLDDRKLSARALFDNSSHRQTQLSVQVQTDKTLCYTLPFHVYVRLWVHASHKKVWATPDDLQCILYRTQLTTFDQSAFHCGLRSMTQKADLFLMKAGRLLSRNMSVKWLCDWFYKLHHSHVCFLSNMLLFYVQISFFKDCGEDDVCTTDLVLSARMDISGTRYQHIYFKFSTLSLIFVSIIMFSP